MEKLRKYSIFIISLIIICGFSGCNNTHNNNKNSTALNSGSEIAEESNSIDNEQDIEDDKVGALETTLPNEEKEDMDAPVSHEDFIALALNAAVEKSDNDFKEKSRDLLSKESKMGFALDEGWYDWDEIPPTGEKYNEPIPKYLAVKIAVKSLYPNTKGEYSDWADKINDFDNIDGRYYDTTFAAYEAGMVKGDKNGNFNPYEYISKKEAMVLLNIDNYEFEEEPVVEEKNDIYEQDNSYIDASDNNNMEGLEKPGNSNGGVGENGALQVIGTQLCNKDGEAVVLHGMSSHGMQWYGQYASYGAIKTTKDYGANIFRVAMYTNEGGYVQNPLIAERVIDAVDDALSLDMYAVIDWHILSDNNPNIYLEQAKEFFENMSAIYADNPAVIYEICNEPNGTTNWENDIKPYAEEIIPIIRANSPKAIIIVGTGTWSQDVHHVSASPLEYENIMYSCHFYSGTHGAELQKQIDMALEAGTPIFISEWGASDALGSGGVYIYEAKQWLEFLDERGISWINWSLCDKNETSAALKNGAAPDGGWAMDDLTESGQFVFSSFIN